MESEIYTTDISVVMPVYNAEKYIKQAVESILNQSFSDFEFIIINDGSTDGTLAILENYVKEDERIHLISRENKGLVATLNEGIDLAGSPLIARMDADDISLPHRFKILSYKSSAFPSCLTACSCSIILLFSQFPTDGVR